MTPVFCLQRLRRQGAGFPKKVDFLRGGGGILNKMAKNCMEITKSTFIDIGRNARGNIGDKPISWVVGGSPQSFPTRETLRSVCMYVCVLERWGGGWGRSKPMSQDWSLSACHNFWSILSKVGGGGGGGTFEG